MKARIGKLDRYPVTVAKAVYIKNNKTLDTFVDMFNFYQEHTENLFNKDDILLNKTYNVSTGQIVNSSFGFSTSNFIEVSPNETIAKNSTKIIFETVYFDKNKEFLFGENLKTNTIKIPDDERITFVRVSFSQEEVNSFMVVRGSEAMLPSEYVPFIRDCIEIDGLKIDNDNEDVLNLIKDIDENIYKEMLERKLLKNRPQIEISGEKYDLLKDGETDNLTLKKAVIDDLPSDFPKLAVEGKSDYPGEFLVSGYNIPYLFKLNEKGEVTFYKKINGTWNFRQYRNSEGKIRYTYQVNVVEPTIENHPNGTFQVELVVCDENFREIDRVRLKKYGSIPSDLQPNESHEYIYIDDGHYILGAYTVARVNNIPNHVGKTVKVVNCIVQEQKNDEVLFQWESINDLELYGASTENNDYGNSTEQGVALDYAHYNSIAIDPTDNNLIVSFRNLDCVIKFNRKTCERMWILGGKLDEFGLPDKLKFSKQHDARFTMNNTITLFNNGRASAMEFALDEKKKTILDVKEFMSNAKVGAQYMGSATRVGKNKNIFDICYGSGDTLLEEFDGDTNETLLRVTGAKSYRVFRA